MKKAYRIILFLLGIFLILDGILSLILGTACLNSCLNNSIPGDLVRVIRTFGGIALIYLSIKHKFN